MTPTPDPEPRIDDHSGDYVAREATVRRVIAAFFEVYNRLGYGLFENVYARALELELRWRGVRVEREVLVRAYYRAEVVGWFRADLIVEGWLVLELKASARSHPSDREQLQNYLRAGELASGMLLHFGVRPSFWRLTIPPRG